MKALTTMFAALALCAAAGGQSSGFRTGQLRERTDLQEFLTPPSQEGVAEGYWLMEEGIRLYHHSVGEGEAVLFLHGGPGFPHAAAPAGLKRLGAHYEVHLYHQRGCGKSTRPIDRFEAGDYASRAAQLQDALGLAQQLADIERIRRILGVPKLTLVGHSFGGFLAALYAAEFPERVERLVLIAPAEMLVMPQPGGGIFEAVKKRLGDEESVDEFNRYLGRFFQTFGTAFAKSEEELVAINREFAQYFAAALEAEGYSAAAARPADGLDAGWMPFGLYFGLGMQYDLTPGLERIRCPVLIVRGADDFAFSEAGLRTYAQSLPEAQVVTIEDAAHFSLDDRPEEVAAAVRAFLEAP